MKKIAKQKENISLYKLKQPEGKAVIVFADFLLVLLK